MTASGESPAGTIRAVDVIRKKRDGHDSPARKLIPSSAATRSVKSPTTKYPRGSWPLSFEV